ncbi:MAG: MarR family transcriptional regulator [Gammaproteobacteria bacterium]|nr:MarR family transcriptional regulator [Gammaproteobacteria bacterium]
MTLTSTWALFLTTHAVLVEKIEAALKKADLPPLTWYDVLWALERAPEHRLRMHELAQGVVLSRSNLTRLVDRLETARLVKRIQATDDKRGAYSVITPAGLAMRTRMWPIYLREIENLFNAHLKPAEDAVMREALRRILKASRIADD